MSRSSFILRSAFFIGVIAIGAGLILPTRVWVSQRQQIAASETQLSTLQKQNGALAERVEVLKGPDQVGIRAGEEFGWVMPGDELYTIPPAPPPVLTLPEVWPFNVVEEPLQNVRSS